VGTRTRLWYSCVHTGNEAICVGRFGAFIKSKRLELDLTLREFCRRTGHDPSLWSKLERGRRAVPESREILERYAADLQLERDSEEWTTFFDLAYAESGRLPPELTDGEIARKLPAFFRVMRDHAKDGGADSVQLLEDLQRVIRET